MLRKSLRSLFAGSRRRGRKSRRPRLTVESLERRALMTTTFADFSDGLAGEYYQAEYTTEVVEPSGDRVKQIQDELSRLLFAEAA